MTPTDDIRTLLTAARNAVMSVDKIHERADAAMSRTDGFLMLLAMMAVFVSFCGWAF